MRTLSLDLETFSDVDLSKCGVYKYASSPAFEILLFGYSVALVNKNWTRIFKFFTAIFLFSNNIFLLYTTFLLDLADSIRFSTIVKPAYALLAQL